MIQTIATTTALCLMTLATVGCGGGAAPGRGVPVSGTVTFDGKPLANANVTFLNNTFAGYGKTDEDGNFRLVQGALPGKNKVVISKVEGGVDVPIDDPESGMDAGQFEAAAMGSGTAAAAMPKDLLPAEYSDPNRTKLTYDVPADGAADVAFNI